MLYIKLILKMHSNIKRRRRGRERRRRRRRERRRCNPSDRLGIIPIACSNPRLGKCFRFKRK